MLEIAIFLGHVTGSDYNIIVMVNFIGMDTIFVVSMNFDV